MIIRAIFALLIGGIMHLQFAADFFLATMLGALFFITSFVGALFTNTPQTRENANYHDDENHFQHQSDGFDGFDHENGSAINPANGMPMMGAVDIEGNPYGTSSSIDDSMSMMDDSMGGFDDFNSGIDDTFDAFDDSYDSFDDDY